LGGFFLNPRGGKKFFWGGLLLKGKKPPFFKRGKFNPQKRGICKIFFLFKRKGKREKKGKFGGEKERKMGFPFF